MGMHAEVRMPPDSDPTGQLQVIFGALWKRIYELETRVRHLEQNARAEQARVIQGKRIA